MRQIQEGKQGGENERVVAKWRPSRNLISMTPNRSPTVPCSSSSQSPRNLTANCLTLGSLITVKRVAMDSNKDNASGSQVWPTDTDSKSSTVKPVARSKKITVGPSLFPHNLAGSPSNVEYLEKVFTYERLKHDRPQEDKMERIITIAIIWGFSMTASMKAAVHLGKRI